MLFVALFTVSACLVASSNAVGVEQPDTLQLVLDALTYTRQNATNLTCPCLFVDNEENAPEDSEPCGFNHDIACDENGKVTKILIGRAMPKLHGTIPTEIGLFTHLTEFRVLYNNLGGTIPEELYDLVNLIDIDVQENRRLSGTLSTKLAQLTKLRYLYTENNNFTGTVPDVFDQMPDLLNLELRTSGFSGAFPMTIGSLTKLEHLDMHGNAWTENTPLPTIACSVGTACKLGTNTFMCDETKPVPKSCNPTCADPKPSWDDTDVCAEPDPTMAATDDAADTDATDDAQDTGSESDTTEETTGDGSSSMDGNGTDSASTVVASIVAVVGVAIAAHL